MLPFTDLSVDIALEADRVALPRARHGLLLRCSPFGPRRSHNVSKGIARRICTARGAARSDGRTSVHIWWVGPPISEAAVTHPARFLDS